MPPPRRKCEKKLYYANKSFLNNHIGYPIYRHQRSEFIPDFHLYDMGSSPLVDKKSQRP